MGFKDVFLQHPERRYVMFGGGGGVGKTTFSAAAAYWRVRRAAAPEIAAAASAPRTSQGKFMRGRILPSHRYCNRQPASSGVACVDLPFYHAATRAESAVLAAEATPKPFVAVLPASGSGSGAGGRSPAPVAFGIGIAGLIALGISRRVRQRRTR